MIELMDGLDLLDVNPYAWLEMWVIVFLSPGLHSMFLIISICPNAGGGLHWKVCYGFIHDSIYLDN